MCRKAICSKQCFNKGSWSATEDTILANYVRAHGEGRWTEVPKRAGLNRCPRSCRLRWLNYLRPDIKRGNISHEEEDLIIRLHNLLGNRWSLIAGRLPGRTDNEIKNYWNTVLKKKKKMQSVKPAVVSIIRSCKGEDGDYRSKQAFETSAILNEASALDHIIHIDDAFKDDASLLAPGEFDLFCPMMSSDKEDLFCREESGDYWVGWEGIQPCGGASVGTPAAFWQCETECLSPWADLV